MQCMENFNKINMILLQLCFYMKLLFIQSWLLLIDICYACVYIYIYIWEMLMDTFKNIHNYTHTHTHIYIYDLESNWI